MGDLDTVQSAPQEQADTSPEVEVKNQDGIVKTDAELIAQKEKGWDKFFAKASREYNQIVSELREVVDAAKTGYGNVPRETVKNESYSTASSESPDVIDELKRIVRENASEAVKEQLRPVIDKFAKADAQAYQDHMANFVTTAFKAVDTGLNEIKIKQLWGNAYAELSRDYDPVELERKPIGYQKEVLREYIESAYNNYINEKNQYIAEYTKSKKQAPKVEGKGGGTAGVEKKVRVSDLSDKDRVKGFAQMLRSMDE